MADQCRCGAPYEVQARFCGVCGSAREEQAPTFASAGFVPTGSNPVSGAHTGSSTGPNTGHNTGPNPVPPRQPANPGAPSAGWNSIVSAPVSTTLDPASIRLAHGEVIKRVFPVARVARPFGTLESQLVVTDSRVLYRARAQNIFGSSVNSREIQVADVSGAAVTTRRGLTPIGLVSLSIGYLVSLMFVWLFNTIATMSLYGGSSISPWAVILFLLFTGIAGFLLWSRIRSRQVLFQVFARSIEASPIGLAGQLGLHGVGGFGVLIAVIASPLTAWLQAMGFLDASDASDSADLDATIEMYEEFGPLILDLQNRGVLGS